MIINISMTLHYGATWWQSHACAAKVGAAAACSSVCHLVPAPLCYPGAGLRRSRRRRQQERVQGVAERGAPAPQQRHSSPACLA